MYILENIIIFTSSFTFAVDYFQMILVYRSTFFKNFARLSESSKSLFSSRYLQFANIVSANSDTPI